MNDKYDRTYLGIDYGEKRIGVAKSDPTGLIASPLMTLEVKSLDRAAKAIISLVEEWDARKIVIGYPLLPSGDKSKICERVDSFIKRLNALHPIISSNGQDHTWLFYMSNVGKMQRTRQEKRSHRVH